MLEKYADRVTAVKAVDTTGDMSTTDELTDWLVAELTEDPDHYLDGVYEYLKNKFRPVIRIDEATQLPVYDETYKTVLEKVLERFNAYEDTYYDA
jgi:hypothetical protein